MRRVRLCCPLISRHKKTHPEVPSPSGCEPIVLLSGCIQETTLGIVTKVSIGAMTGRCQFGNESNRQHTRPLPARRPGKAPVCRGTLPPCVSVAGWQIRLYGRIFWLRKVRKKRRSRSTGRTVSAAGHVVTCHCDAAARRLQGVPGADYRSRVRCCGIVSIETHMDKDCSAASSCYITDGSGVAHFPASSHAGGTSTGS
jgi:hypothetical protein